MKSRPRILLPNRLSFLRILIGLFIPVLLFWPLPEGAPERPWTFWTALGFFIFGALTDFWDGWMARRYHLETRFGRILDPTADKIFILAAMAAFAAKGLYPYWYLVPIILREVAVTFCRIVWLQQGRAVGAERAGKLKLGIQVTSVLGSFLALGYPAPWTFYLNEGLILLALLLTLYSGYFFFLHNRPLLQTKEFARSVGALGVGHLRPAPGTYGSLLGLAVVFCVSFDPLLHFFIFVLFLAVSYTAIPQMGLHKSEDPLDVVIDEVCGVLLAFWTIPLNWATALVGFLLFRLFDVTKVFPIGWLEQRKGTHGIMLDDLGAGVYTWILLRFLLP